MRDSRFAVLAVTITLAACGPRLGAVPTPGNVSEPVCSSAPSFGRAIDAFYPSGLLQNGQGMVPVVGMDRLEPIEPAFEYFAAVGIANGLNIASYAMNQT